MRAKYPFNPAVNRRINAEKIKKEGGVMAEDGSMVPKSFYKKENPLVSAARKVQDKLSDVRLNKSGTISTEPVMQGGRKYTELKFGKLGSARIPQFKKGGPVKKTGLAIVHKGEYVVPKGKKKNWRITEGGAMKS